MADMVPHFLDARGQLADLRGWLAERLGLAFDASAALLPLRDTDVVVKAGKHVIPETGHAGFAPEAGLVYVTVDPEHAALRLNADRSLERMLAHELHHSARWDGPGYGRTLGAALVSEGLAGHFVQEVFGGGPEPWESLSISALRTHIPRALHEWEHEGYAHEAWFFGSPDFPRWLGYSLGYQLVARYLASHPGARASGLVHEDARVFLPHLGEV